jgi:hypothetical protein
MVGFRNRVPAAASSLTRSKSRGLIPSSDSTSGKREELRIRPGTQSIQVTWSFPLQTVPGSLLVSIAYSQMLAAGRTKEPPCICELNRQVKILYAKEGPKNGFLQSLQQPAFFRSLASERIPLKSFAGAMAMPTRTIRLARPPSTIRTHRTFRFEGNICSRRCANPASVSPSASVIYNELFVIPTPLAATVCKW